MKVFNHPFNKENCKKRLLEEYNKYGKLIVAFDFDNTIYDYHKNGGDYSEVIKLLQDCSKLGFELILFTTEEDHDNLLKKIHNVDSILGTFNYRVNRSSIFSKAQKPYYNILLDDRAGLEESYEILKYVVDEIKSH